MFRAGLRLTNAAVFGSLLLLLLGSALSGSAAPFPPGTPFLPLLTRAGIMPFAALDFTLLPPPARALPSTDIHFSLAASPQSPLRPRPSINGAFLPRNGRAWLELGAFMAYSQTRYWIKWWQFVEDQQFKLTFRDQWRRTAGLAGLRFDSNAFSTNWTHGLAGAWYYQFSRANARAWSSSLLMSLTAAAWWEVVTEFKEVISINDLVMTTVGGYAIGEPWFQLGDALSHHPSPSVRWLGLLNPVNKVNEWLDGGRRDAGAYEPPGWHAFSLFVGARRLSKAGGEAETSLFLGLRTQLIAHPDYGKKGEVRETVKDTFFSEISLDMARGRGGAQETNFTTRAVSLALFRQSIDEAGRGSSFLLGLGSRFSYFDRRRVWDLDIHPVPVEPGADLRLDEPRNFADKLAVMHVAGPVMDWTIFRGGLKLRTVAEVYLDFAMANAYALNDYSRTHDVSGMKTTVLYYGYYYGLGASVLGEMSLEWRSLRLRTAADLGAWGSIDVLDRFQPEIAENAHLDDRRLRYLAGAGWKLPGAPLEVFANFEGIRREGKIKDVAVSRLEKRLFAGLLLGF
jgi:hypothetical protein